MWTAAGSGPDPGRPPAGSLPPVREALPPELDEADGDREGEGGEQDPGRCPAGQPQGKGRSVGDDQQCDVFEPRARRTEKDGERAFSRLAIGLEVAIVIDDEDGDGKRADRYRGGDDGGGEGECLHVISTTHGADAEKDKDKEIAQSVVADGKRSTAVGEGRQDGSDAQDDPVLVWEYK